MQIKATEDLMTLTTRALQALNFIDMDGLLDNQRKAFLITGLDFIGKGDVGRTKEALCLGVVDEYDRPLDFLFPDPVTLHRVTSATVEAIRLHMTPLQRSLRA